MTKTLLWNSIATHRRSVSDTFLENGLWEIKTYLDMHGHECIVRDWAVPEFYGNIAPKHLVSLNRRLFSAVMDAKNTAAKKALGLLLMASESLTSFVMNRRMDRELERLAEEIVRERVRVLGVKVWYGEAFKWSEKLIEKVEKRDHEIITVAGGYHPTIYEEDFLRYSRFDLAVVTQGEYVFKDLLDFIKREKGFSKKRILDDIEKNADKGIYPNLIYRKGGEIRKTARAPPVVRGKVIPDYSMDECRSKIPVHVIIDSYGCDWGKCYFCSHPCIYPQYMPRPIDEMISEFRMMLNKGIGLFRLAGSDTPVFFGERIAEAILKGSLKLEFGMGCRAIPGAKEPGIYKKLVRAFATMQKAGLVAIFMGAETGNDRVNREIMNKGVTREDIIYTIKAAREAEKINQKKMYISLAMIYPCPVPEGTTLEEVRSDNLSLARKSAPDSVIISPPAAFKNTAWYNEQKRFGFSLSAGYIKTIMTYEYVLFKPPEMWPKVGYSLDGVELPDMLKECSRLRQEMETAGIQTDITDEYFMMIRAGKLEKEGGIETFKKESVKDIVSADYRWIDVLCEEVKGYSNALAGQNRGLPR